MENSYLTLIEQERAKIALLKAKIAECEQRIQILQSMMNADDLDNILAKTVAHESSPQPKELRQDEAQPLASGSSYEMPKKKLSSNVLALLSFIETTGKSLDELEAFSAAQQLGLDRGAIRSFASNYRIKYGFLHSPRTGFFQLTERGEEYLEAHGVRSKGETPSVGAEGVSDTSIQAAVEGGTESDELI